MDKRTVISIPISTGRYDDFINNIIAAGRLRQSEYVCVANVHMLVEAHKSPQFAGVVESAAYVTPDGKPLAWALRLLHGIQQERVAGMTLLPDLLKAAEASGLPVYIYGGTDAILQKTERYLHENLPALTIAGTYSPPFRDLSLEEESQIVQKINDSQAGLVFVVLGCPRQEKWMSVMKGRIHAVMIGVGGALPVMIGDQRRAPQWMQTAGLEWFHRMMQEPGRLFKRYAITNSIFLYLLLKAYWRKTVSPPSAKAAPLTAREELPALRQHKKSVQS